MPPFAASFFLQLPSSQIDMAEACGSRTQTFNSQLTANDDVAASAEFQLESIGVRARPIRAILDVVGRASSKSENQESIRITERSKFRAPDTPPWETAQNHLNGEADDAISFCIVAVSSGLSSCT